MEEHKKLASLQKRPLWKWPPPCSEGHSAFPTPVRKIPLLSTPKAKYLLSGPASSISGGDGRSSWLPGSEVCWAPSLPSPEAMYSEGPGVSWEITEGFPRAELQASLSGWEFRWHLGNCNSEQGREMRERVGGCFLGATTTCQQPGGSHCVTHSSSV